VGDGMKFFEGKQRQVRPMVSFMIITYMLESEMCECTSLIPLPFPTYLACVC